MRKNGTRWSERNKRMYFEPETLANGVLCLFEIVASLEIEPELWSYSEKAPQTQCDFCRDGTLSMNNLVDRHGGYSKSCG